MCGCKDVWREDMRKLGRRARVQGRLARKVRRNLPGVSECRDVWRARRAETCRVSASARTSPTVIARSEATWQSASPAAGHDRKQCFGRIRESAYEFALRITNLQSFSAGTRIAAPVCALVRNDNRGAWVRIRPKYCQVARFPCGENGLPHQCAHWFAMTC